VVLHLLILVEEFGFAGGDIEQCTSCFIPGGNKDPAAGDNRIGGISFIFCIPGESPELAAVGGVDGDDSDAAEYCDALFAVSFEGNRCCLSGWFRFAFPDDFSCFFVECGSSLACV